MSLCSNVSGFDLMFQEYPEKHSTLNIYKYFTIKISSKIFPLFEDEKKIMV